MFDRILNTSLHMVHKRNVNTNSDKYSSSEMPWIKIRRNSEWPEYKMAKSAFGGALGIGIYRYWDIEISSQIWDIFQIS